MFSKTLFPYKFLKLSNINFFDLFFRLFALVIPIIAIKFQEFRNDEYSSLCIKLIGIGAFLHNLLATDFHTELYQKLINRKKQNQILLNKYQKEYIAKIRTHLILIIPLMIIIFKPINYLSFLFIILYVVSEKIFDETSRYIQCFRDKAKGYTKFIFIRRTLHFLPMLFAVNLHSNYMLSILMISSPLSILIAWLSIKKRAKALLDIKQVARTIISFRLNAKDSYKLKLQHLLQPIAAFSLSAITILPYEIIGANKQLLANYAIIQRFSSLPLLFYLNSLYINKRKSILKLIYTKKYLFKEKLLSQTKKEFYLVALLVLTINLLFFILIREIEPVLASSIVFFYLSSNHLNQEIIIFKLNIFERFRRLFPLIIFFIIILSLARNNLGFNFLIFMLFSYSIIQTLLVSKSEKITSQDKTN